MKLKLPHKEYESIYKNVCCVLFLSSMIHQEPQSSGLSSRLTALQEDVGKSPGRRRSACTSSALYGNATYSTLINHSALFVCAIGLLASAHFHLTALGRQWYLPTTALSAPLPAEPCRCQRLGQN